VTETRIALVTGANRGIGLEIVRQLARLGVMAVVGSRDLAKARAAAESLKAEGLDAPVAELNVDDDVGAEKAIADVVHRFGSCDILVNNAGIIADAPGGFEASVFDLEIDSLRQTLETNLLGPFRLIQAVVPLMRERDYGRIVNLSSGAGQLSKMSSGYPAYRMSKVGLNALTRIASAELAATNIKVNAVCPGWVRTDMGGPNAERTIEQGAETPVWLAMLPDDGPTGGFFRDRKQIPW
jgi:NAD(P)-dependent dehydrogenase (short-subunit alcohol dehydrogenase family)